MKYAPYLAAAVIGLCSTAAFAQGGSPYNSSGSQAGGPRGGVERRMGDPGGTPDGAMGGGAMQQKPMMRKGTKKRMRKRM